MSARHAARRAGRTAAGRQLLALLLPLLGAAACTETNITRPKAVPGNGVIVFSSNREDRNYEIFRIGANGAGLTRLTHDLEHNDYDPVLSRDGGRIAWEREVPTGAGVAAVEIWVMDANGGNARVVVRNGAFNESPSWLPGDTALVYASDVTGDWEIYRVSLAGGAPVNLTNAPFALDQHPRVSPDGTRILFQTNRDLNFEIYSMDARGGDVRNLSKSPGDDRWAAWTPDGRVVWSRYDENFDLWLMNADGSGQKAILRSLFSKTHPAVSPDGQAIVFQSDEAPPSSLFVMPITGGAPRLLTGGPGWKSGSDQTPWWGVDR